MKSLQIASSSMEFYHDQVRALRREGIECDKLYSSKYSNADNILSKVEDKIHGHNSMYYLSRSSRFYPKILKKSLESNYDIIHINCGMVAPFGLLQPQRPVVMTLWGDDLLGDRLYGYQPKITKLCAEHCHEVIVRSEEMERALPCDAHIIPSGVDMDKFYPISRDDAIKRVGWDSTTRHVIFPYPKTRQKKRYPVAKEIVDTVNENLEESVTLQVVRSVPHDEMYLYYNAADALLLPSLREGSPNTVKEAMACNLPIVSTDVGDVRTRLGPVDNSYVCDEDSELADALTRVLSSGQRSNGREYVREVSLQRMGERIHDIYESVA